MSGEWRELALCRRFPDLPWIAEPQDYRQGALRAMKSVCDACPVSVACAKFADLHGVTSAFYAGHDRTPPGDVAARPREKGAA